jgi:hypothetical protein
VLNNQTQVAELNKILHGNGEVKNLAPYLVRLDESESSIATPAALEPSW